VTDSADSPRILHVPRRFTLSEWGGTESVITHLCEQQRQQGYRPEIHTSRALDPTPFETFRQIPVHRYRYTYPFLGLSAADRHALDKKGGNLLSLSLFQHLVRARGVRLFHAHVLKRMGGSVMTAARLRRKPFVVTLHGNVFDVPDDEATSIVQAQQGHFEWGRPFGALFRSRAVLTEADAVICVGHSEYLAAREALGHERVHHLPNGVSPGAFEGGRRDATRARLGWGPDTVAFGCLSRIDPQKNQLGLLEAFARHLEKHPTSRLLLAGPATLPEYRARLEQRISHHDLAGKVTLLGAIAPESDEQRDLLAALDAFVLASRHEPFGIVILEAWAASLPVAVARVGGLQRLVTDERTGLHAEPGDSESLAAALDRLAAHPELRHRLAAAGRAETLDRYTWQAVAGQLETLYQQAEAHHSS
jgi:glycosyltransferase involved in cell wall biosynthesis